MSYFVRNQEFAFGIDLSRYNASADLTQMPDFDQIAAHDPTVNFIAIRAGVSWGYRDPMFRHFSQRAQAMGACLLPYHVLYPGEPALKQVDSFLKILEGLNLDEVRLVLDVELEHGHTRAMITNTLLAALELLEQETGRLPIVYSRAMWVDANLRVADLPKVDWWLAQYYYRRPFPQYTPEYPCPPRMPKGVDHWLIHQTSERGPAIGGVGNYMDYDRWNGTPADVLAYFGQMDAARVICPLDGEVCPVKGKCAAESAQCQAVEA